MRRPLLLAATLTLLLGSGLGLSQRAWSHSHADEYSHEQGGYCETVGYDGITLSVNQPVCLEVSEVHGPGDVVVEQQPNSWYYVPEYRTEGCIQLQGAPNGFGGWETVVYNIHTSERDTWASIRFQHDPDAVR